LQQKRWRVDIYYSGFTTVCVEAQAADEAVEKGRTEAEIRLSQAVTLDPDGAMAQLIRSLEPWEACDTAGEIL
jgi:hypothetical protein